MFRNAHCLKSILWVLETKWWSRKIRAHLLSQKHQNHKHLLKKDQRHIDKKDWNLRKKILYIQRQSSNHRETAGEIWDLIKSHTSQVGDPQAENTFITELSLTGELEFWAPIRLPRLGVWHQVEGAPARASGLKARGAWWKELYRTRGNRKSTLGGYTQISCARDPGESSDFLGAWARSTSGLEGLWEM